MGCTAAALLDGVIQIALHHPSNPSECQQVFLKGWRHCGVGFVGSLGSSRTIKAAVLFRQLCIHDWCETTTTEHSVWVRLNSVKHVQNLRVRVLKKSTFKDTTLAVIATKDLAAATAQVPSRHHELDDSTSASFVEFSSRSALRRAAAHCNSSSRSSNRTFTSAAMATAEHYPAEHAYNGTSMHFTLLADTY
jgi:hypothetical protein